MYGKMVKSGVICMIAALTLILSVCFMLTDAKAQTGQATVYTACTRAQTDRSGDGTKENPYNRFEDALKNVADGGKIYILSTADYAYVNVMDQQNAPLLIDKSITIEPEPGAGSATLYSRAAGMILGADVTMNNIILEFANGYHDQIFVNGHSLTLNNVTRLSNFRLIDIVAGGLYNKDGSSIGLPAGTDARITIDGQNKTAVQFGNVYAGSMNGRYDGNTSITLKNLGSSNIGEIYGCGAKEVKYDTDNWFDVQEELPPPEANAAAYPVSGKVNIALDQASTTKIDGAGAVGGAAVSLKHTYLIENNLLNLSELQVKENTRIKPIRLTGWPQGLDVSLAADATLDISGQTPVPDIGNFTGGGTLMLTPDQTLEISGALTGDTFLAFPKQGDRSRQGHAYIKAKPESSGTFSYNAKFPENGYLMKRQANGEWHIVKGNNVTVSYDVNFSENDEERGSIEPWFESVDKTSESLTGSEVVEVADGYHFVHWIEKENGTVVGTEETFVPSELKDGEYIAVFEGNQYKVRFHANGGEGTMEDQTFVYHEAQNLTRNAYQMTGSRFTGWNTAADGTGTAYTNGQSVDRLTTKADQIIDLYAQWEALQQGQYEILYVLNGGTNHSGNPETYTENDTVILQEPTRTGYTFDGWYTDKNFATGTKITQIAKGSTGTLTLYAKWTQQQSPEPETYNINYVLNVPDGTKVTNPNPEKYTAGTALELQKATRTGYDFAGWYTDKNFATEITQIKKGTSGNLTLYAKWTQQQSPEPETYNINYVLNVPDGTKVTNPNPADYTEGKAVTLKNPTRTGYTFIGWHTRSGMKVEAPQIKTTDKGNKTFYAKWARTPYTITYKVNGGTLAKETQKTYNIATATFTLKNPTRTGYTFGGWYTNKNCTGTKVTQIKKGTTGNKTFYAKWNKVTVAKAKTPVLTNLKGRSLRIKYSATSGAKGYQVQYATSKKFTKAVTKTTTSKTYTAKKLQKGKTYHVRVRAYKTDSKGYKVYGSWSTVKSKKITK